MELRELDESKSPSVPETDNGDIASVRHVVTDGEPIVHAFPVSADYEPPLPPDRPTAVEIDMVDEASPSSFRVT